MPDAGFSKVRVFGAVACEAVAVSRTTTCAAEAERAFLGEVRTSRDESDLGFCAQDADDGVRAARIARRDASYAVGLPHAGTVFRSTKNRIVIGVM